MKKIWKYGILVLFVALFALSTLCGCGGPWPSDSSGSSSGNSNGGGNGGGQSENPAPKPEFASGSGTESDPYVISAGYQWANVANHLDAHYRLGADLNLGDLSKLQPIGDSADPFTGTLDGQNHKIHSAEITIFNGNNKTENAGLFGVISGGIVKNLHLNDSRIKLQDDTSCKRVGSIAGQVKMGAHVENIHIDGVTIDYYARHARSRSMGSIIGTISSASEVIYCSAKASLISRSISTDIGGLFGTVEGGRIDACFGYVSFVNEATSAPYVGGLIGEIVGGKISNIYAEITFEHLYAGIAHMSQGGYGVEFGLCFNGSGSNSKPLYYNSDISVKDTTSHYFNSATIESSNEILDSEEWKENKLWKKGKLHPELVSYEEYLALTAEA